jgi:serine/threonine protein kinase
MRAGAEGDTGPEGAVVHELIARLKGMRLRGEGQSTTSDSDAPSAAGEASAAAAGGSAGDYVFLAPPQEPGEIGRLGPYRVLKLLGAGGMGLVFQAEDPRLQRPVALKVMRPDLAASPRSRERFLREARAAAALRDDHVVTVYQVDEDWGVPFLAMELLEGETLEARLRREGPLPLAEVLRLGREAAEGLAAAHGRGLVHRDVKPANIWLEDRSRKRPACELAPEPASETHAATGCRVKLLDFGLARAASGSDPGTQPGVIVGTPQYMAPEQARGEAVDARSDLFSLGCVLYDLATGQPPFRGKDTLAVLSALATEQPLPPHELRPELPPALSDLVMRLLAKNPAGRPPDAEVVARSLRALEGGAEVPGTSQPRDTGVARPRSHRRWLPALAAAVGLVVLGLGVAAWRLHEPPPPLAPLKGYVDVRIYEEKNPHRQNLYLNDTGALPLKAGDQFCIEAELNRPAYLYVLWIDPDGDVHPAYPWEPEEWSRRPSVEQPVARLRCPEALDAFYKLPAGRPGMHTLVLLARDTPLEPGVDLQAELGKLPPQEEKDLRASVWFENGRVVKVEANRQPRFFDAQKSNDPVLQTQQRIRERLQRQFTYTRAVSFAHQGK